MAPNPDGLTDRQRKMALDVVEALDRGESVQFVWSRRQGATQFKAFLDEQMAAIGWTVVAPGVYQPPDEDEE